MAVFYHPYGGGRVRAAHRRHPALDRPPPGVASGVRVGSGNRVLRRRRPATRSCSWTPQAPADAERFWAELDALAEGHERIAVLITIHYHARSTTDVYRRYSGRMEVSVHAQPSVRERLGSDVPMTDIEPGEPLPRRQGIRDREPATTGSIFIPIAGRGLRRRRGGSGRGAAAYGSYPGGVAPEWYGPASCRRSGPLLDLDSSTAGHAGPPVIGDGRERLRQGWTRPPWSMRSERDAAQRLSTRPAAACPSGLAGILIGVSFGVLAPPVMGSVAPDRDVRLPVRRLGAVRLAGRARGGRRGAAGDRGRAAPERPLPADGDRVRAVARRLAGAAGAEGRRSIDASWAMANQGDRALRPRLHGRRDARAVPSAGSRHRARGRARRRDRRSEGLGLDALFPAFFLALLVPELRNRTYVGVAVAAAALTLVLIHSLRQACRCSPPARSRSWG